MTHPSPTHPPSPSVPGPGRLSQLDILTAIVDQLPPAPAIRRQRSLGPRPPWSRFWEKVDRRHPGGCWIWTASTYRNGYGQFTVLGVPVKAHRWAYQNLVGRVPQGMQLDHLCHTTDPTCSGGDDCTHRRCVNPAHLEPVTPQINAHRGNGMGGINIRKTHCKWGHPFDVANTRIGRDGRRVCRRCHANKCNQYRDARRQLAVAR